MSTKAEKAHMGRVAELGCVLCLLLGYGATPAECHHPRTGVGTGRKSSNMDVIGLCPQHHRLGNDALHVRGRKAWERLHGFTELELLAEVRRILGITA